MGLMSFLRNRMGTILVTVIAVSLVAFLAGDVIKFGGSFFHGNSTDIGEVYGEPISRTDFDKKVEENTNNFREQSRQSEITPQITNYIQATTWNQEVSRLILNHEMDKLGLVVGDDEMKSLIQGDNPSQQIVQAFGDPATGKVDRNKLLNFLNNISSRGADTTMQRRWRDFVAQIVEQKRAEKYLSLVSNGLYVNSLEAKDDYEAKNKLANFKYVKLDYASIPDNKVTLTDDDYKSYYDAHKGEFKNPQETRSLEYVSFNAAPSKADSAAIKAQVDKLLPEFKSSTNDSLFVEVNSDTKTPITWQRKGQLEPKVDSIIFSAPKGFVYGPYLSNNGSYKMVKLVDERIGPDSVKASHVLLPLAGGADKALKTADSLKKLIQAGQPFAALANKYSADKGSAEKGGELGMFGRGTMVAPFEDAVFNGKPGDLVIVTSQFGVHLIKIEDQKGSSKVVKVAVVDKPLVASSATQSAAYSKAQAFLGSLNKDNFDDEAKKAGVKIQQAPDISGEASGFPGVESARDIVRWAYKAEVGDFSDQVYTSGNQYIVARLLTIKPQGVLPLEVIKNQIQPLVANQVKGKLLSDKLQNALSGSGNIEQVAQKAGSVVVPAQNIVAANPVLPGAGPEYKLVGSVFASQPGKLSKPVEGNMAVYVFSVDNFIKPAPLGNAVREKQQIGQALIQRSQQQVLEALKDKANVKDYRFKFL